MSFPPTGHAEGFGSMLCPQNVPRNKHRTGGVIKCPEELLLIKTLVSVFICADMVHGDGTRNSSIFLYIKRTCRNVSPFFVPKSVPKVVFLWFLDIK